jgi:hypothetical protein
LRRQFSDPFATARVPKHFGELARLDDFLHGNAQKRVELHA